MHELLEHRCGVLWHVYAHYRCLLLVRAPTTSLAVFHTNEVKRHLIRWTVAISSKLSIEHEQEQ
jgi:hypothetical protein